MVEHSTSCGSNRDHRLEEADDTAGLGVEPDLPETRARAQAGHSLHVAEDGVEEARAGGQAHGADGDCEA